MNMQNCEEFLVTMVYFDLYSTCQVQFLQYLNALTHDDYVAALDNLHRYFDYRSVPNCQSYERGWGLLMFWSYFSMILWYYLTFSHQLIAGECLMF